MKNILFLSFLLLSVGASAQRHHNGHQSNRNAQKHYNGKGNRHHNQQGNRYVYTTNSSQDIMMRDARNLKLSRYQETEFYRLIQTYQKQAYVLHSRNSRNKMYQLQQLENDFDYKVRQLLNKNQYNQWHKKYAHNYRITSHQRIYS